VYECWVCVIFFPRLQHTWGFTGGVEAPPVHFVGCNRGVTGEVANPPIDGMALCMVLWGYYVGRPTHGFLHGFHTWFWHDDLLSMVFFRSCRGKYYYVLIQG